MKGHPRCLRLGLLSVLLAALRLASADLVLDMPLREGEGDTTTDAILSRVGAVANSAWIKESFGSALEFNGADSALSVPADASLSPAHGLTVSAWVKFYAFEPKLQRIVQRASGTWGLYLSGTKATFYTQTEGGKEHWRSVSAAGALGEWLHLVGVYDGAAMRLYVNGVLQGETEQDGLLQPASLGEPLRLGHDPGGQQTLMGALSGVRIWDEALDAAAVVAEYQAARDDYAVHSPFPPSPVMLLTFDEGKGEVAADQSIAHNDATVRGAWVAGKFGSGLQAGPDGGASVRFNETLNLAEGITLEAWVRQESATKEMQRIAFRSSAYGLYTTGVPSGVTWYVMAGGEWSSVRAPLPQGRWVRVTGTYDGQQLRLFYDGEEVAAAPKTGPLDPNSSALLIGHGGQPEDTPFQGAIDEVFVVGEAVPDFPERRSADLANPESVPVTVVPYVADVAGALPSAQAGRMSPPKLDGVVADDEWQDAARLELRDALTGQAASDGTVVRAGYDDEKLYVSYVCEESDVEGTQFVHNVAERDGPVWADDCAEILIQPEPPDGDYFHFAVNSAGIIYDALNQDAAWNSVAEAAGKIDEEAGRWALEIAIPWTDLTVDGPPLGRTWAANFCREQYPQKALQAWSPTRSFHRTDRFGRVAWAERSRVVQAGSVTVFGRVLRGDAEHVAAGVTVRIGDRMAMTRPDGVFKIAGVPEGEVVLQAEPAPNYHPLAVSFSADAPSTVVIPPPLGPVDLQAHSFELPASPPFRVLPLPVFEEPPLTGDVPAFPAAPTLELTATQDEYEPVTFAVYAGADVPELTVAVTDVRAGGNTIPAEAVEVRLAARTMQRRWYTSPINDSVLLTRYLWPYKPEGLRATQFRQYWLTLHVPADTPGGDYGGTVTISGAGHSVEVPLSAHVLGMTLRRHPEKRYGCYYRGSDFGDFTDLYRYELPDMRAHGCDFALWRPRIGFSVTDGEVDVSYEDVEQQIEILRENGFRPPWIIWSGLDRLTALLTEAGKPELIQPTATRAIRDLLKLAEERDWGPVYLTHMDEVFNQDRLPRYIELTTLIRNAADVPVYMTIRADRPEMMEEADPYIDIRCYNGHNMDEWISSGHSFEELAGQLEAAGDEAWIYYNPRSVDVTPEWTRTTNGLYMWLTPFRLHTPWIYNSFHGSPFDAEDGHDFGYAFPSPEDGRPVPTLLWEAFREGVDDLRYIYTLEQLVEAAPEGNEEARAAREYLERLRGRLVAVEIVKGPSAVVKAWSEELTPDDWVGFRREVAAHIEALADE
jgi:hypothetical protein